MNGLRVGVIGVGYLGQHHARIYESLPHARLVGVADLDSERCRIIGTRHQVQTFSDFRLMVQQVDAVSVAVPTSDHFSVAKECLAAGVHVLVEKPIASTVEEGRELVELARGEGLTLQVGHSERFNPIMELIRPRIKNPGFVECHRLAPFQPRGTDIDVVLDLMIHDLDIVLSFGLGKIRNVEAVGVAVLSPNIDFSNARIEFENGCVANLTASRVSTGYLRKLRLFQPDEYISVDYQTRRGILYRRVYGDEDQSTVKTEHLHGDNEEPLERELGAFIHAVRSGSRPLVSGEDGTASLELAHKVLAVIKAGESPVQDGADITYSPRGDYSP
ncbi:MAG: Gfo/Idh/MocA family oxidoreductase [Nitrospinae bacterium]|nr:Gfo/Idh/MocA family oxidoreductase [Nitrospinota bacterium]